MRTWLVLVVAVMACGMLVPGPATAASLGVVCWELQPGPDVVCVDLDDDAVQAGLLMLEIRGTQTSPTYVYPVVGGVTLDGLLLRVSWTTYDVASGVSSEKIYGANIPLLGGPGTWFSSSGDTGDLVLQ